MEKKDRTILIGCGTGRCGTTSLAKLIGGCKDAVCEHERRPLLPWLFNEDLFQERVKWFSTSKAAVTGDVAYFYLPYLEKLIGVLPGLKIVCLERDRQAVIDSFMWKTRWQNRWNDHDGTEWAKDAVWDQTFPNYDIMDKQGAIGAYWDDYRIRIRRIANKFPLNVLLVKMEELNTFKGQQSIFDFLDMPEKNRRYVEKPRYNARESAGQPWNREEAFRWMNQLTLTSADIAAVIPPESAFILVDQELVRDYIPALYRVVPFLERDGVYWGPPPDSSTAIRELSRLRQSGSEFIIFAWPSFWWLNYYVGLCTYLRSNYPCLIENERIVVFDLRKALEQKRMTHGD